MPRSSPLQRPRTSSAPARGRRNLQGSRASSTSSGASEPESTVAGSGNPASSVSSGRVEAEGRGGQEYNEGVGGKYTCAGCGARPFRSAFLIEATDLEGKLCVERDWEGGLYGRCYECCRGRGPRGGLDIYAPLVGSEEELQQIFKNECNKRHLMRINIKKMTARC